MATAARISTGNKQLRWIKVSDLRISPRAQRDHNRPGAQRLIDEIAANFDPDKFGTLTVNERDNTFWVVDGGHRTHGLLQMGWGDQLVQCWTYKNLTEEQEADLFLDLNNVRAVQVMDKFKVAVIAGRHTECDIDHIVRAAGLAVGSGTKTTSVQCVGALLKVYEGGGPTVLSTVVRVVRDAYGRPGFTSKTVEGLGMFVANYEHSFDEARLVARLSAKHGGVNGLLGRAEQIKSSHGVTLATGVAAAAVETYNQGRGGKKLDGFWAKIAQEKQTA